MKGWREWKSGQQQERKNCLVERENQGKPVALGFEL